MCFAHSTLVISDDDVSIPSLSLETPNMTQMNQFNGVLTQNSCNVNFAGNAVEMSKCLSQSAAVGGFGGGSNQTTVQSIFGGVEQTANLFSGVSPGVTSCPAISDVPEVNSCEHVSVSGRFSVQKVNALKSSIKKAVTAACCHSVQLVNLTNSLGCYQQKANNIKNLAESVKGYIQQQSTAMNEMLGTYDAEITERTAQMNRSLEILNGDPASGRPGLNQLLSTTQKVVNEMPAKITQVENGYEAYERGQEELDEYIDKVIPGALTAKCFQEKKRGNFVCDAKSAPVSAKDYLLCRYKQQKMVQKSGKRYKRDHVPAHVRQEAQNRENQLSTLLETIFSNSPTDTDLPDPPSSPDANVSFKAPSGGVTSTQGLLSRYGSQLKGYNDAFDILLNNYKLNKEITKKKMVEFFEVLGATHEITVLYRRKLSSIIFS